jgi:hypothetical protein
VTAYEKAQAIAQSKNLPCYELFGCKGKVDVNVGFKCKGNCEEVLKKYMEGENEK